MVWVKLLSVGWVLSIWGLASLCAEGTPSDSPRTVRTTPAPPWVEDLDVELEGEPTDREGVAGVWYVLLDRQEDAGSRTTYVRNAVRFLNQSGVEEWSDFSVTFNPAYQRLFFHAILVHRDGEVIDRLAGQKFRVLELESRRDRRIFDGRLSAIAVLDDIRVGDTLEYAYSVQGENPVFGERFYQAYPVRWAVAVGHLRYRLLWAGPRELRIRASQAEIPLAQRETRGGTEFVWQATSLPAVLLDDGVPSDCTPFGWVELSDYESWDEVREWALRQYDLEAAVPEEISTLAKEIANLEGEAARVAAALRFVQDDVRYVAVPEGIHSHRPYPLATILKRRFGDCKDKSLLLTTLLRELGIDAQPALVNTDYRGVIEDWLPSPLAFNHAVVRAEVAGEEFWLDATRSHQRGRLGNIFFPDIGHALIVGTGHRGLAAVSGNGLTQCRVEITEEFRLEDYAGEATLNVVTDYHGCEADIIRAYRASESQDSIEKGYVDFYSKSYGDVELLDGIRFEDREDENLVRVTESYRITDLWEPSEDEDGRVEAWFSATVLGGEIATPSARNRTLPFGIEHPNHVTQTIKIHLPSKLYLVEQDIDVDNPAFRYRFRAQVEGRSLHLNYSYVALKDRVEPDEAARYVRDVDKASESLTYGVWIPAEYQKVVPPDEPGPGLDGDELIATLNLPVIFLALLVLAVSAVAAIFVGRWQPVLRPRPPLAHGGRNLNGMDGWLILVAIGVVLAPFLVAVDLVVVVFGDASFPNWEEITTPGREGYDALWLPAMLTETSLVSAQLVFSLLIAVLFFSRRYTLPRLMIAFLAYDFVAAGILALLYSRISTVGDAVARLYAGDAAGRAIACAIWIPYFLVSKRVKATFTRGIPRSGAPEEVLVLPPADDEGA